MKIKFNLAEIERDIDLLHNALRKFAISMQNPSKSPLDLDKMATIIERIRADAVALHRHSVAAAPGLYLSNADRDAEIASAVIAIGKALQGGRVYSVDHFAGEILATVPPAQGEFWALQAPQMFAAMLANCPEIAQAAEQAGVLAWTHDDPGGTRIRMVNATWLTDEDEIAAFVTAPAPLGKRCRFCTALEPHDAMELQPVEADQNKLDALTSGMAGRTQQRLEIGRVHLHAPCLPYWQEWVEIARRKLREAAA